MEDIRKIAFEIISNSMEYNGEEMQIMQELEHASIDELISFIYED